MGVWPSMPGFVAARLFSCCWFAGLVLAIYRGISMAEASLANLPNGLVNGHPNTSGQSLVKTERKLTAAEKRNLRAKAKKAEHKAVR